MKKRWNLIIICAIVALLSGCEKPSLPAPDYQLCEQAVADALTAVELNCTLVEETVSIPIQSEQTTFNLYGAADGEFVASVKSVRKNGERMIALSLPPQDWQTAVSVDACQGILALASLLYGEFADENQVYRQFIREFPHTNTQLQQHAIVSQHTNRIQEIMTWENEIKSTACRIQVKRPAGEEAKAYLSTICFATDLGTFLCNKLPPAQS